MQSRDLPSAQFEDPGLVQTQPAGRARVMWRMGKAWGGVAGVQGALPQGGSMQLLVD